MKSYMSVRYSRVFLKKEGVSENASEGKKVHLAGNTPREDIKECVSEVSLSLPVLLNIRFTYHGPPRNSTR